MKLKILAVNHRLRPAARHTSFGVPSIIVLKLLMLPTRIVFAFDFISVWAQIIGYADIIKHYFEVSKIEAIPDGDPAYGVDIKVVGKRATSVENPKQK